MVRIVKNNNNTFELEGKQKSLMKIYKAFKLKHPGAFFLRKSGVMPKGWDGHIDYVTDSGKFKSGLLQAVYDKAMEIDGDVKIIDNRKEAEVIKPKIVTEFNGKTLRDIQRDSVLSVINNKVGGELHPICIIDAATNAGKTIMMASLYASYKKRPTIILLKSSDLFNQFKRELPELLPREDIKFVQGKNLIFGNLTVAMIPTLSPKVNEFKHQLEKFEVVLVDEADEAGSKSYKTCIQKLYNTKVRIGLSGSIYMSKLKKDAMSNRNLESFFGSPVIKITKKEMVDKGYSTPVVVTMIKGSDKPGIKGYPLEYETNISKNKDRAKIGAKRLARAARYKRLPALIVYRFIEHGELLLKVYRKHNPNLKIELVYGSSFKKKEREKLLKDFREGSIDVLISSMIVKRGQNFPLIRYIQNASATDSNETVSQIMGRGERTHESKKKYYLDDFMDEGQYLKRHSKHRKKYYEAEGFTMLLKY